MIAAQPLPFINELRQELLAIYTKKWREFDDGYQFYFERVYGTRSSLTQRLYTPLERVRLREDWLEHNLVPIPTDTIGYGRLIYEPPFQCRFPVLSGDKITAAAYHLFTQSELPHFKEDHPTAAYTSMQHNFAWSWSQLKLATRIDWLKSAADALTKYGISSYQMFSTVKGAEIASKTPNIPFKERCALVKKQWDARSAEEKQLWSPLRAPVAKSKSTAEPKSKPKPKPKVMPKAVLKSQSKTKPALKPQRATCKHLAHFQSWQRRMAPSHAYITANTPRIWRQVIDWKSAKHAQHTTPYSDSDGYYCFDCINEYNGLVAPDYQKLYLEQQQLVKTFQRLCISSERSRHSILHSAAAQGDLDIVKFVVDNGADVRSLDDSALYFAAKNGHFEIVKFLVVKGANIRARNNAALLYAVSHGDLPIVKFIVEAGADVNAAALPAAAASGHRSVVEYLVEEAGADIHRGNEAALCAAVLNGEYFIVKYLVDKGADIHAQQEYALLTAVKLGHTELVAFLADNGADIHYRHEEALSLAARYGHLDIVRYLVHKDVDIHAQCDNALFEACSRGHLDVVRFLVEHGADIHAGNGIAFNRARSEGHWPVVGYLRGLDRRHC